MLVPSRILVCVPTYNERENIGKLVPRIFAALPDATVLIIDDNSPDKTAAAVTDLAGKFPRLRLLLRTKNRGFGPSYLDGFRYALDNGFELIVQMDADLSHPPETLPDMVAALRGRELVVGSRYRAGGGVERWSGARRLLSAFGNAYARFVLRLPIRDLTGGYNLWRAEALRKVISGPIVTNGYGFLIELKVRAHRAGIKIAEFPFYFQGREHEGSKMTLGIMIEAAFTVLRLGFVRAQEND